MKKEVKQLLGIGYFVLLVLVLALICKPQVIELKKLKVKKQFIENEMNYMNLEAAKFEENEEREKKLELELNNLNRVLLTNVDSIALYQKFVKDYKNNSKIDLLLFEPSMKERKTTDQTRNKNNSGHNNQIKDKAGTVPLKLSFRSGYGVLVDYLGYIEEIGFITSVKEISMKSSSIRPALLDIDLTVNLYTQGTIPNSKKTKSNPIKLPKIRKQDLSKVTFISPSAIRETKREKEVPVDFTVSGIVGDDTIIVGDNVYSLGDSVNGWKVLKIDQPSKKVTVQKGKNTSVLLSR